MRGDTSTTPSLAPYDRWGLRCVLDPINKWALEEPDQLYKALLQSIAVSQHIVEHKGRQNATVFVPCVPRRVCSC